MPPVWTNWAGQQRCAPVAIERPASPSELAAAMSRAVAAGRRLRVAGSGHSFTDIACTDGHMIDLARMRRVLDSDPESGLVTVEGGITLKELGRELAERGLAMENQGDIDAQTLAGSIATGTHGTGARFRNLSAQVEALRLVTAGGDVIELSEESDPEAFLAARISLGALGAIAAVTLRCVPLFTIHRVDEPRPVDEVLTRFEELSEGHDHFEFFLLPYTDRALTLTSERTDRPPVKVGAAGSYLRDVVLENRLFELVCRLGRRYPTLIPRLNRRLAGFFGPSERTDHSYRVYANRRDVRFTEMEYAIPRSCAREAIERVLDTVERRRLPVNFPVEVRVVAPDDAFLSPAGGRDTCYVAVHQYRGMEFETYFRAVESVMDDYGGRPHWGKRHYQTAATLRPRYPDWDRFQAVRARLDPDGVLANDYTDRVLGPVGAPVAA